MGLMFPGKLSTLSGTVTPAGLPTSISISSGALTMNGFISPIIKSPHLKRCVLIWAFAWICPVKAAVNLKTSRVMIGSSSSMIFATGILKPILLDWIWPMMTIPEFWICIALPVMCGTATIHLLRKSPRSFGQMTR